MMKAASTIQGRMLKALAIVVVSALVLGGMSLYAIFQSHQSAQSVSEDLQQNARQFLELRVAIESTISNFALIAANKGASGLQNLEAIRKAREDFVSSVNTMIDQNQGKSWFSKIEDLRTNFNEADSLGRESALAFVDGKTTEATAKQEILQTRLTEIRTSLDDLSRSIAAEHQARLYGLLRSLLFLIIPVSLMAVLIPFVYLVLTGRKLNQELLGFVSRLQNHSEQNDRTSEGLKAASTELSSASRQQSAAVQESVSSIAQIRSMLSQTSSHVHEAQSLASNVNDKTKDGGKIMARMEAAMSSIEQSNAQLKSIAEIIEAIGAKTRVINDIVFKTQLLSFNASIEAARAGQYGRGFAVVAEEVGKLAHMSGSASHEIDHLLRDSLNRVDQIVTSVDDRVQDGKEVSSEALKRFAEIARQIEQIRDKIDQVGHATAEQENGISQTARSMDQMDHSALSNKKSAENMSKLAEVVRSSSVGILDVTTGIRGYVRLNSKAS